MNTDELKSLWKNQPSAEPPAQTELIEKALKFRKQAKLRLVSGLVCLSLTFLFIAGIGYCIEPEWLSTRMGLMLVLLAIFIYLIASGQALRLFRQPVSEDLNANAYLSFLLTWREKQAFLQNRLMTVYFAMLTAGLVLYMLEYAHRMGLAGGLLAYAITALWIGFNWFYIRPRMVRKQKAKTDELIARLELLNKQFAAD